MRKIKIILYVAMFSIFTLFNIENVFAYDSTEQCTKSLTLSGGAFSIYDSRYGNRIVTIGDNEYAFNPVLDNIPISSKTYVTADFYLEKLDEIRFGVRGPSGAWDNTPESRTTYTQGTENMAIVYLVDDSGAKLLTKYLHSQEVGNFSSTQMSPLGNKKCHIEILLRRDNGGDCLASGWVSLKGKINGELYYTDNVSTYRQNNWDAKIWADNPAGNGSTIREYTTKKVNFDDMETATVTFVGGNSGYDDSYAVRAVDLSGNEIKKAYSKSAGDVTLDLTNVTGKGYLKAAQKTAGAACCMSPVHIEWLPESQRPTLTGSLPPK